MSATLKLSGALKVGALASDPINPEVGLIYFNTTDGTFKMYENGAFRDISAEEIAKLGTLNASPSNYTPSAATYAGHLDGIDTALATAGGSEFADDVFRITGNLDSSKKVAVEADGLTTATTRTITMPDSDVNLGDIATNTSNISANTSDISDIRTTQGTSDGDTNLGTFTGTTISDNTSVKGALQQLETEVETKVSSSNLASTANGLGASLVGIEDVAAQFTSTNVEGALAESLDAAQAAQSTADNAIPSTEKGAANGVATLDSGGKVPVAQLPNSVMEYLGTWAASTNTPTLSDGVGNAGDVYIASDAGTVDFGSGGITFATGDWVIYNGATWEKSVNSNAVASVNGQTGAVVLDADDIDDAATTNKFVTAADITKLSNITITQPVDLDSVESLATTALQAVSDDTTPSLGGNLTLGSNVVIHDSNGMKRGSSASDFLEEEYIHSISLTASQTGATISELTFGHASFEGMEVIYKLKEATSNDVRIGTLRVVTNGTSVVLNDVSTETADVGIAFSAVVNGSNIEIHYDSGSNAVTMRCDVKRIKA